MPHLQQCSEAHSDQAGRDDCRKMKKKTRYTGPTPASSKEHAIPQRVWIRHVY